MTTGKHLPRFCGRIVLAACAIAFALLLGWREWSLQPDGRLHLYFLDVGQGDATLVVLPFGTTIVIDGGPDWSALSAIGSRTPFFRRRIDLLVLTHPHLDHVASLPELVKRYDVGMVLLARTPYASGRYAAFANALQERGVPVTDIRQRHIQLESGAVLDVLWPPPGAVGLAVKDVNAASVVAKLRVRGHAVLFTGDAEKTAERALLAAGADLRAEVLKVGHHGSRDSSTPAFLAAVGAKTAIISSGTGNTYGHPHSETLARLASMEARVLRTDTLGTISLVLN
jgi:competence protein ComEC